MGLRHAMGRPLRWYGNLSLMDQGRLQGLAYGFGAVLLPLLVSAAVWSSPSTTPPPDGPVASAEAKAAPPAPSSAETTVDLEALRRQTEREIPAAVATALQRRDHDERARHEAARRRQQALEEENHLLRNERDEMKRRAAFYRGQADRYYLEASVQVHDFVQRGRLLYSNGEATDVWAVNTASVVP